MLTQIENILKQKKYPPVLLLFGEEEFLIEEATKKLLDKFCPPDVAEFNFDTIDPESDKVPLTKISEIAASFPFMSDRRVLLVRNFHKYFSGRKSKNQEKEAEPLLNYLKNPNEDTFLILVSTADQLRGLSRKLTKSPNAIKNAKFPYNEIIGNHAAIEFPKVWDNKLFEWTRQRFIANEKQITPDAVRLLVASTDPNLRMIAMQIEKVLLRFGEEKNITLESVKEACGFGRTYTVFDLQSAVALKKMKKSIFILENLLRHQRQEMLIISILTNYFSALWKLSDLFRPNFNKFQLAKEIGVNPFFLDEYISSMKKYPAHHLDNAFRAIAKADEAIKSGAADPYFVMQKMIIEIIEGRTDL